MSSSPFSLGGSSAGSTASSTACIGLGNYIPRPTKFKISGVQAGKAQTVEIVVKPFSFQWSEGWDTGPDKMVNVETPYFSKCFSPFVHPGHVAIYR